MFTKEERLFIWKKVYEMIDWQEDGEYICVALRKECNLHIEEKRLSEQKKNLILMVLK